MYPFLLAIVAAKGTTSPTESVNLSGTAVSPRTWAHISIGGNEAVVSWLFGGKDGGTASIARGEVQRAGYDNGVQAIYTSIDTGTDWVIPHNFQEGPYWFRGTLESGDAPNIGLALGVWTSVSNDVNNFSFGWQKTGGNGTVSGTVKVEIATDSGGSNIVATGYYKGTATNEP